MIHYMVMYQGVRVEGGREGDGCSLPLDIGLFIVVFSSPVSFGLNFTELA